MSDGRMDLDEWCEHLHKQWSDEAELARLRAFRANVIEAHEKSASDIQAAEWVERLIAAERGAMEADDG